MKINNSIENYLTTDIKLQAFLRTIIPDSFIGFNKIDKKKVCFIFTRSDKLLEYVKGYLLRKEYLLSPMAFAENIDQGKAMIFGDY